MRPHRPARIVCAALLAGALVTACASAPILRAANGGDRAALRRAVVAAEAKGQLRRQDVVDAALAVLEREVAGATAETEAISRIRDVRGCAFAVTGALESRAALSDEASGEAALELQEAGELSSSALRRHATSTDDRWRAAAMWERTGRGDHDAREAGLKDGSPFVRRAALHAIVTRDDGSDFEAVLAVARLDPAPLVRTSAVRALARLTNPPASLVTRLQDLWVDADGPLREDIARVYASPAVFRQGGEGALARALVSSTGNDAVSVASVILSSRVNDPGLRAAAVAALVTALRGEGRARAHAVAVAPLDDAALREAMTHAADADDVSLRVGALGRLADPRAREVPAADRDHAREELEALARPGAPPALASRARLLLAEAHDLRVQAWLEDDLADKSADARLNAAAALAALGRAGRAAPLLADEDASVRTRAACTMVVASRFE